MNNGRYIDISHIFSFLSRYYTLSTTVQRHIIVSGLLAYSVKVITVLRAASGPDAAAIAARGKTQNSYMGILPWECQLF